MDIEQDLGLGEPITRRDFVGGVAASVGLWSTLAPGNAPATDAQPHLAATADAPYPPLRTGLRGQHPGSFEDAHRVRDGAFLTAMPADTGEHFDLVVVGAGISGLSAAHFYRRALGAKSRVLLLDNHDDFGGHAKRNEFHHEGRIYLSYGGTMSIETPFPYSFTARSLLAELGVDPASFSRYQQPVRLEGLGEGVFFDRENFHTDRLVAGAGSKPWAQFFAEAPLTPAVREDLARLYAGHIDYLPSLDAAQKAAALKRMSYATYLTDHARLRPEGLAYFRGQHFRNNMRVDTCPAFVAWRLGAAGFNGMDIQAEPLVNADYFHFPDGNASIARLLVNRLVPAAFDRQHDQESIVLARLDYSRLDEEGAAVRLRLDSTAVRVEHIGAIDRATERAVRVVYVKGGELRQVTAANVVLACFNTIIPFLVPTLPEPQRVALRYASKVPMMYTSVLVRNWEAWRRLGVHAIEAPNGYHSHCMLDTPLRIGGYESVGAPQDPVIVHLIKNWNRPGLPRKQQNRLARGDMLAASFESIEHASREQLQRMLGSGGFEAKRDILAITVNRWPHGYAYTYDTLDDPDLPEAERPHVIGRRAFGRISIANADAGASAFTNVAIDQAERAIQECLVSRGMI
ncbi:MAG: FAD/NAD(P)-binding protein [Steroidobacteraceae bacterium]